MNRSWLLVAVLALLAVTLELGTPVGNRATASAAGPTGSISGFVSGPNGPLAGVLVSADSYYLSYAIATTDATGHYTLSGLAPGTFHVQFTPPAGSDLLSEWFQNEHTSAGAAPVVVVGGATASGVNAFLEKAGHIAGTVTGPNGTYPNYTTVCFYNPGVVNLGSSSSCAQADAAGRYVSPALAPGSYVVNFNPYWRITPQLSYQTFDGSQNGSSYTPVVVTEGTTVGGVNARLRPYTSGSCTTFGPDCGTIKSTAGCITATQTGPTTVHLVYTCEAQSVQWTSNNDTGGHNQTGNPVDLTFSPTVKQWAVHADATVSSTVAGDNIVFKFATGPAPAPAAPIGVVAAAGVEQAAISWVAPAPGATQYKVTASPGAQTCTWTTGPLSCSIKGLTPGTPYTFTVVATSLGGPSAPSAASAPVTPTARRFVDVGIDHTFYLDIEWLAGSKITTGYPDGTYRGSLSIQRQAMAAFLYRLAGSPNGPAPTCSAAPFTDVPVGAPFCGEISWLKGTGISTGSNGSFNPMGSVTRAAMAAFLYRFAGAPNGPAPTCSVAPFTDVPVGAPFCGEITWLKGSGITTGFPNGSFGPGNPVTRAAMAAFLHRLTNM